uniref:Transmembrane protein 238a n=1 Tax=Poecilia latipinna TaxID=48699 RepID=A0A3B3UF41_9TELE
MARVFPHRCCTDSDPAPVPGSSPAPPPDPRFFSYDGLSHCKLALVFAVVMDVLGVTFLLVGVFASLEIQGEDFGDLLVYSGALLVLFSMAGWVLWYSGNIEGLHLQKDPSGHMGSAMDRLARSVSRRMRLPRTSPVKQPDDWVKSAGRPNPTSSSTQEADLLFTALRYGKYLLGRKMRNNDGTYKYSKFKYICTQKPEVQKS